MPHADPESSFDVAARHLFRHVSDANELRSNPLVRPFFDLAAKDISENGAGQSAILAEIHARILKEADAVRQEYAAAGLDARACRQYAIVAALCAGERPQHTYAKLHLSRRYYYQERQVICTRVAQALMRATSQSATRFEVSDSLRILFARVALLRDGGFARKAESMLDEAYVSMPDGMARSAVRLELARTQIALGLPACAEELLTESDGRTNKRSITRGPSEWLNDHYTLIEVLLAMETGHDAAAGHALEALAKRRIAEKRVDEDTLDILVECDVWYCQNGRLNEARKMLRHIRDLNQRLSHASARQQIAIAAISAYCAQDCADEFGSERHWLGEAMALGISNGSVDGMLTGICGLMRYYASIGNDDEVYTLAAQALGIARTTEGIRTLEIVGVQIVTALLGTRYWRTVDPLLFEVEKLAQPGSFRWGLLKGAQGSFLMRTGRYDRAQISLTKAYEVAKSESNRKLEATILRDLAVARHHAGLAKESIELMRHAIKLAEEHLGKYSLSLTYDAAARLLADPQIARLARRTKATLLVHADPAEGDGGRANSVRPRLTLATAPLTPDVLAQLVP